MTNHEDERPDQDSNQITAQHRRMEILEIVFDTNEKVRTGDLAKRFNIGQNLLAYDLRILEEMGLIDRGHGWCRRRATAIADFFKRTEYAARRARNRGAKQTIARYINAQLVADGHHLLMDAGSTCYEIGKRVLEEDRSVTVTTNNLPLALYMSRSATTQFDLVGGAYSRNHAATVGPATSDFIEGEKTDLAVLAPRSLALLDPQTAQADQVCGPAVTRALAGLRRRLDEHAGSIMEREPFDTQNLYVSFYVEDPLQHAFKSALVKNANHVVVAVDHSKWAISGEGFLMLVLTPFLKQLAQTRQPTSYYAPVRTRGSIRTRGALAQQASREQESEDIDVRDPIDLRDHSSATIVTSTDEHGEPPAALLQMVQSLPWEHRDELMELVRSVVVVVGDEGKPVEDWTDRAPQ